MIKIKFLIQVELRLPINIMPTIKHDIEVVKGGLIKKYYLLP